jgi:hypothetical protein
MRIKGKSPRGSPNQDGNNRSGNTLCRRNRDYRKELRRTCRTTETDERDLVDR